MERGGRRTSGVSARRTRSHAYPLPRDIDDLATSTTISMNVSRVCHDFDCTSRLTLGSTVAARSQPSRSSSTPALFTSASSRLQSRLPLAFTATAQPCPGAHTSRSHAGGAPRCTLPLWGQARLLRLPFQWRLPVLHEGMDELDGHGEPPIPRPPRARIEAAVASLWQLEQH